MPLLSSHLAYTPFVLPLVAAAGLCLWLGCLAVRRAVPGARILGLMLFGMTEWLVASIFVTAGTDVPTQMFWYQVEYIGVTVVPTAWLLFSLRYTGRSGWFSPVVLLVVCLEPAVILGLALTNGYHGLMWPSASMDLSGPFAAFSPKFGPMFWVNIAYTYAVVIIGTIVLGSTLHRAHRLYRAQALALCFGVLAPLVGNVITRLGLTSHVDLAPFAFTATGVAFFWGFLRLRFMDLVPVARTAVFDFMADSVLVLDQHQRIVDLNPAARQLLHPTATSWIGQPIANVSASLAALASAVPTAGTRKGIDLLTPVGLRHYDVQCSSVIASNGVAGMLLVLRDMTDRNEVEAALAYQATHDQLTDLPNRAFMNMRLDLASASGDGTTLALLLLDLDHFKDINDSLGHHFGDLALIEAAQRLRSVLPGRDDVARLGGDEFAVLVENADHAMAEQTAARLLAVLSGPLRLDGVDVSIRASIGIALCPEHGTTRLDLMRRVDIAMYAAKRSGGGFAVFDTRADTAAVRRSNQPQAA
jgi:diguanylate cyclase (GGDEF)-like protein